MIRRIQNSSELHGFYDYFEKVYFSHHLGLRKPDREIFETVLADMGVQSREVVYIDDSKQHTESAQALGIKSLYLQKQNSLAL